LREPNFDWDDKKNLSNQKEQRVSFDIAQYGFSDPHRIIARDISHSKDEERFFCFAKLEDGIITIRFTHRGSQIRIIGAGYWRKGKKIYEEQNQVHFRPNRKN
jgi:uncharacterized protein